MSWGKFLLSAMLGMSGMQGALITNGSLSGTQASPYVDWQGTSMLSLSDGVIFTATHDDGGTLQGSCTDRGSGCFISGPNFLDVGHNNSYYATINISYSTTSFFVTHGTFQQSFQSPFTVTGSVSYVGLNGPLGYCPISDPVYSCSVPFTGTGIATITASQESRIYYPGDPINYFVSGTTLSFTSTPEPATYLLSLPLFGILFIRTRHKRA